ncbi:adenosylmethionine decarboxylase [bacterium]|nr:adenosylmethionine decarboxylase [bacterium]
MDVRPIKKLKLYGFNNLTKSLSFNIYDICYAMNTEEQKSYLRYIDDKYNSNRLTDILTRVAEIIGANIINIASQDYEPRGASVAVLIAEQRIVDEEKNHIRSEAALAHMDKSHLSVHTYPESHPENGIASFRVDIDASTCGKISPLNALNFLINSFESDIILMDYRVRGFTRETHGRKVFLDHKINSIQNFINEDLLENYHAVDVNIYQENIFHTKLILKEFDLDNYLFDRSKKDLPPREKKKLKKLLKKEMNEIFYGRNIPEVPKEF